MRVSCLAKDLLSMKVVHGGLKVCSCLRNRWFESCSLQPFSEEPIVLKLSGISAEFNRVTSVIVGLN